MTNFSTALAATALAAAALAAPAIALAADPTFAAFAAVCADTRADFPAVTAAAAAHRWRASDVSADTLAGVTVTDKLSRAVKVGDASLTLFAWRGTTKQGIQVSACTVRGAKSSFTDLRGDARAWAGFEPQENTDSKATFHFTDAAGVHRAQVAPDYESAAAGAGLEILTVSGDNHGAVLDLLKIKK